jgi:hypothetical protein
VADAQADYDHALAGLQHQANAAWDEYAQAMEAAGCTPAGGPIQFVAAGFRLSGEQWVWPWSEEAAALRETLAA